jgi:hypothetical protein
MEAVNCLRPGDCRAGRGGLDCSCAAGNDMFASSCWMSARLLDYAGLKVMLLYTAGFVECGVDSGTIVASLLDSRFGGGGRRRLVFDVRQKKDAALSNFEVFSVDQP